MKFDKFSILFNGAGIALGLFLVIYMVRSALFSDDITPCTARYPTATELSLIKDEGGMLSPIELQARLGVGEFGLLESAEVVAVEGAPAPAVLNVKLAKGTSSAFQTKFPRGGVGFRWAPSGMDDASAACLSYKIRVPKDFEFARGGLLPGLYGSYDFDPTVLLDGKNGFATRVAWRDQGAVEIQAQIPGTQAGGGISISGFSFKLDRGRWVGIEQEVVLNTPGQKNGQLRLWVDGTMRIERKQISMRASDSVKIAGVIADISYGGLDLTTMAGKDTNLLLSPLEVRWPEPVQAAEQP